MIKSPKYGMTVYYKNTGTASAAPYLSGTIESPKPIDEFWVIRTELGRRKLLLPSEMYKTMAEAIKEG